MDMNLVGWVAVHGLIVGIGVGVLIAVFLTAAPVDDAAQREVEPEDLEDEGED